jgi:hypothetical protein
MVCEMRTFSFWSQVSQTSTSAVISFVSSVELQQYPARGLVFFAVGIDFGNFSTFSRSVFNIVKRALVALLVLCTGTGMMGEGLGMGTVVGVDGMKEGPATGWEFDVDSESVEVDKRKLVRTQRRCHTFVEIDIQ